jgi:hypothetical protein
MRFEDPAERIESGTVDSKLKDNDSRLERNANGAKEETIALIGVDNLGHSDAVVSHEARRSSTLVVSSSAPV